MNDKSITYEQPLNEVVRASLRLEQLFQQIDRQLNDASDLSSRNVIACIIDILHLLDRPDLKSKLAKEFSYHLSTLSRYNNLPDVNKDKLKELTQQLESLSRTLIDSSGKIGYRLRDIELLSMLRLHLASPGGGCGFDLPLYHYWLQQPMEKRRAIIVDWLTDFTQIRSAIELMLDLVRKNSKVDKKTAVHGFYQELLDPQAPLRMIRIHISPDIPAYPEISVGRHFLSVRFYLPDIEKRPTQYTENLAFQLDYCNL
ncbi:MAG: hypothetical protein A3F12_02700 [Gammaproteobacteria bacterium RIFCSPHIGHO2_12_FULL_38_14]|nr:MAG: hypothetical protein A3F12_02700 [Gammaproteobacteria bacterium RIFCSPHIGHO2_12_FULL_38_14]